MDNRHLTAPEGMLLTNGDIYATEVWLGEGDSADNWREITKEEVAAMMATEDVE